MHPSQMYFATKATGCVIPFLWHSGGQKQNYRDSEQISVSWALRSGAGVDTKGASQGNFCGDRIVLSLGFGSGWKVLCILSKPIALYSTKSEFYCI